MHTIDRDIIRNLQLLRDDSDPPRFYLQQRRRRDLIAIRDESLARSRFALWRSRTPPSQSRIDQRPTVAGWKRPPGLAANRPELEVSA